MFLAFALLMTLKISSLGEIFVSESIMIGFTQKLNRVTEVGHVVQISSLTSM